MMNNPRSRRSPSIRQNMIDHEKRQIGLLQREIEHLREGRNMQANERRDRPRTTEKGFHEVVTNLPLPPRRLVTAEVPSQRPNVVSPVRVSGRRTPKNDDDAVRRTPSASRWTGAVNPGHLNVTVSMPLLPPPMHGSTEPHIFHGSQPAAAPSTPVAMTSPCSGMIPSSSGNQAPRRFQEQRQPPLDVQTQSLAARAHAQVQGPKQIPTQPHMPAQMKTHIMAHAQAQERAPAQSQAQSQHHAQGQPIRTSLGLFGVPKNPMSLSAQQHTPAVIPQMPRLSGGGPQRLSLCRIMPSDGVMGMNPAAMGYPPGQVPAHARASMYAQAPVQQQPEARTSHSAHLRDALQGSRATNFPPMYGLTDSIDHWCVETPTAKSMLDQRLSFNSESVPPGGSPQRQRFRLFQWGAPRGESGIRDERSPVGGAGRSLGWAKDMGKSVRSGFQRPTERGSVSPAARPSAKPINEAVSAAMRSSERGPGATRQFSQRTHCEKKDPSPPEHVMAAHAAQNAATIAHASVTQSTEIAGHDRHTPGSYPRVEERANISHTPEQRIAEQQHFASAQDTRVCGTSHSAKRRSVAMQQGAPQTWHSTPSFAPHRISPSAQQMLCIPQRTSGIQQPGELRAVTANVEQMNIALNRGSIQQAYLAQPHATRQSEHSSGGQIHSPQHNGRPARDSTKPYFQHSVSGETVGHAHVPQHGDQLVQQPAETLAAQYAKHAQSAQYGDQLVQQPGEPLAAQCARHARSTQDSEHPVQQVRESLAEQYAKHAQSAQHSDQLVQQPGESLAAQCERRARSTHDSEHPVQQSHESLAEQYAGKLQPPQQRDPVVEQSSESLAVHFPGQLQPPHHSDELVQQTRESLAAQYPSQLQPPQHGDQVVQQSRESIKQDASQVQPQEYNEQFVGQSGEFVATQYTGQVQPPQHSDQLVQESRESFPEQFASKIKPPRNDQLVQQSVESIKEQYASQVPPPQHSDQLVQKSRESITEQFASQVQPPQQSDQLVRKSHEPLTEQYASQVQPPQHGDQRVQQSSESITEQYAHQVHTKQYNEQFARQSSEILANQHAQQVQSSQCCDQLVEKPVRSLAARCIEQMRSVQQSEQVVQRPFQYVANQDAEGGRTPQQSEQLVPQSGAYVVEQFAEEGPPPNQSRQLVQQSGECVTDRDAKNGPPPQQNGPPLTQSGECHVHVYTVERVSYKEHMDRETRESDGFVAQGGERSDVPVQQSKETFAAQSTEYNDQPSFSHLARAGLAHRTKQVDRSSEEISSPFERASHEELDAEVRSPSSSTSSFKVNYASATACSRGKKIRHDNVVICDRSPTGKPKPTPTVTPRPSPSKRRRSRTVRERSLPSKEPARTRREKRNQPAAFQGESLLPFGEEEGSLPQGPSMQESSPSIPGELRKRSPSREPSPPRAPTMGARGRTPPRSPTTHARDLSTPREERIVPQREKKTTPAPIDVHSRSSSGDNAVEEAPHATATPSAASIPQHTKKGENLRRSAPEVKARKRTPSPTSVPKGYDKKASAKPQPRAPSPPPDRSKQKLASRTKVHAPAAAPPGSQRLKSRSRSRSPAPSPAHSQHSTAVPVADTADPLHTRSDTQTENDPYQAREARWRSPIRRVSERMVGWSRLSATGVVSSPSHSEPAEPEPWEPVEWDGDEVIFDSLEGCREFLLSLHERSIYQSTVTFGSNGGSPDKSERAVMKTNEFMNLIGGPLQDIPAETLRDLRQSDFFAVEEFLSRAERRGRPKTHESHEIDGASEQCFPDQGAPDEHSVGHREEERNAPAVAHEPYVEEHASSEMMQTEPDAYEGSRPHLGFDPVVHAQDCDGDADHSVRSHRGEGDESLEGRDSQRYADEDEFRQEKESGEPAHGSGLNDAEEHSQHEECKEAYGENHDRDLGVVTDPTDRKRGYREREEEYVNAGVDEKDDREEVVVGARSIDHFREDRRQDRERDQFADNVHYDGRRERAEMDDSQRDHEYGCYEENSRSMECHHQEHLPMDPGHYAHEQHVHAQYEHDTSDQRSHAAPGAGDPQYLHEQEGAHPLGVSRSVDYTINHEPPTAHFDPPERAVQHSHDAGPPLRGIVSPAQDDDPPLADFAITTDPNEVERLRRLRERKFKQMEDRRQKMLEARAASRTDSRPTTPHSTASSRRKPGQLDSGRPPRAASKPLAASKLTSGHPPALTQLSGEVDVTPKHRGTPIVKPDLATADPAKQSAEHDVHPKHPCGNARGEQSGSVGISPTDRLKSLADTKPKLRVDKTNRKVIKVAIQYLFQGEASRQIRETLVASLESEALRHDDRLLVLFRGVHSGRHDFRAMYSLRDQKWTRIVHLLPSPPVIDDDMCLKFFRFDSAQREFKELQSVKTISGVVDAVFLKPEHLKSRVIT